MTENDEREVEALRERNVCPTCRASSNGERNPGAWGCPSCVGGVRSLDVALLLRLLDAERAESARLREALGRCADGMRRWARDEDGIHPEAWDAYVAAVEATPMQCPCATLARTDNLLAGGHHPDCQAMRGIRATLEAEGEESADGQATD